MTVEEAIERINEHIAIHRYNEPQAIRIAEALQMGIDALEKQVPKIVRIGHEYLNKYRHVFYCPNCKHMDVGDVEKWHYCPLCGQALKMEGET